LKPNTYYTVKVDGSIFNTYLSNSSGEISFTYTGEYSDHVFEVLAHPYHPYISRPFIIAGSSAALAAIAMWMYRQRRRRRMRSGRLIVLVPGITGGWTSFIYN